MFRTIGQIILATVASATVPMLAIAQRGESAPTAAAVKNIVLVRGAFADGSGWGPVYQDLTARGYGFRHKTSP